MKAKVLIISFLVIALILTLAFVGRSQVTIYNADGHFTKMTTYSKNGEVKDSSILLADETWLTYVKTGAKITSYSEQAFKDISLKFGDQFSRISILYKSDRNGPYKEYNIYLTQDLANTIRKWAKTNL